MQGSDKNRISQVQAANRSRLEVADRLQFSLRELFAAMTSLAAVCGLAVWQGVGTLTYSLGLLLSLLNVTGRLECFQSKRTRPKCFYAAWGLLLVSLFLPAVPSCNRAMPGWEAAWSVAAEEVQDVGKLFKEDNEQSLLQATSSLLLLSFLNLANILALLSPLLLYKLQRNRGKWMGSALAVCCVAAWSVGWGGGFLVGYYFWCLGFAALLVAYRISWLTFGLMIAWLPIGAFTTWLLS